MNIAPRSRELAAGIDQREKQMAVLAAARAFFAARGLPAARLARIDRDLAHVRNHLDADLDHARRRLVGTIRARVHALGGDA